MKTRTVVGAGVAAVGAAGLVTFLAWPQAPHDVAMRHVLETVPAENICRVTTLQDSGPGSLRDCVLNRNGPRYVVFADLPAGGTITALSQLKVEWPYLTIDGSTAPPPGITYFVKQGGGIGVDPEFKVATHDVVIHGIHFAGSWKPGQPTINTAVISVDGDHGTGNLAPWDPDPYACGPTGDHLRNSCRIVLDQNTFSGGADSNSDFWCGIKDLTFSRNLVIDNFHPRGTGCKGFREEIHPQARIRITEYANVYAFNGERTPKLNEGVYDYDFVNGIAYAVQNYDPTGGFMGYGLHVENDGGEQRHNVLNSFFLPDLDDPQKSICEAGGHSPNDKFCRERDPCRWGTSHNCDPGPWDPSLANCEKWIRAEALHYAGNVFGPLHNPNECISTPTGQQPLPRPYSYDGTGPAGVEVWSVNQLEAEVLDKVGAPYKTPREQEVIEKVRVALRASLGQPSPSPSSPPPSPSPSPTASPTPPPGPVRYKDEIFSSSVKSAPMLYSSAYSLYLDVYSPPASDTVTNRPWGIVLHGGNLTQGNRTNIFDMVGYAKRLARSGWVVASIDYRLIGSLLAAEQDALAALNYMKAHAAEFGIDPNNAFVAGFSSGGHTAVGVGFRYDDDLGLSAPPVRAVFTLDGFDLVPIVMKAGDPVWLLNRSNMPPPPRDPPMDIAGCSAKSDELGIAYQVTPCNGCNEHLDLVDEGSKPPESGEPAGPYVPGISTTVAQFLWKNMLGSPVQVEAQPRKRRR